MKIKNYKYTILPYKNKQKRTIKVNLNNKLEGTIDFNVKGKPNPPVVNLLLKFQKINNTNISKLMYIHIPKLLELVYQKHSKIKLYMEDILL